MLRVLIIDTDEKHGTLLKELFNLNGCDAKRAASHLEGVFASACWDPHLIICEEDMPKCQAWTIAKTLAETPQNRPYLIVMTKHATRRQKALCEEHGFDLYALRPIGLIEVKEWIEKGRRHAGFYP